MRKNIPIAIAYDFDGTLAPGNMQERDFIPDVGMTKQAFWDNVGEQAKAHQADNILIYMKLMLEKANSAEVPVRRKDFEAYGRGLDFFQGVLPYKVSQKPVLGWFKRINKYGKESGVSIQHFIISSGIREMVTGSPVAKEFTAIYASSFCYDHNGVAKWPALAINYTNKTQYLFRINKGALEVYDHTKINKSIPKSERAVPFEHIMFVGDGDTDVPCFRLIKDQGGHAIAVYRPSTKGAKKRAVSLCKEGRVNFIAPADYREGHRLDKIVKGVIDKIAFDQTLAKFAEK